MIDPRISIRLSNEEHMKFKMIAVQKKKSMQELLIDYVRKEIKKAEGKNVKKKD